MRRLTAFIDGDTVLVDDTAGNTRILPSDTAAALARQLFAAWHEGTEAANGLTAAAHASLEEAANVCPDPASQWEPPDTAAAATGAVIQLGPIAQPPDANVHETLQVRRSRRTFRRIALVDVASLLTSCTRVAGIRIAPDGYPGSLRPAPSAGGRHPIDLELYAFNVEGLEPGRYAWDPYLCELGSFELAQPGEEVDRWETALASDERPSAIITLVAEPSRTLAYYPAGMAHVWRDAGVLLGYLNLVATACSLNSTILGTCGRHARREGCWEVGALAIG